MMRIGSSTPGRHALRYLMRCSLALVMTGAACLTACSTDREEREVLSTPVNRLERDTGTPWHVRYDDELGTPAMLLPLRSPKALAAKPPVDAVRDFIVAHADLFNGLREDALRTRSPIRDAERDATVITFDQLHRGVPVDSGQITVVLSDVHEILAIQAHWMAGLDSLATASPLPVEQVLARAQSVAPDLIFDAPHLLVMRDAGNPWLGYALTGYDAQQRRFGIEIDAQDGRIVFQGSLGLQAEPPNTPFQGEGFGSYAYEPFVSNSSLPKAQKTARKFPAYQRAATPYENKIYCAGHRPLTPEEFSGTSRLDKGNSEPLLLLSPTTCAAQKDWRDLYPAPGVVIDSLHNISLADRYFRDVHGRASWNGQNGAIIVNHSELPFMNAHFEATRSGAAQLGFEHEKGAKGPSWASMLDGVAHEYTHAVLYAEESKSGDKRVARPFETRVIHEGLADIFAGFAEHHHQSMLDKSEDALFVQGDETGGLRSAKDPTSVTPARAYDRELLLATGLQRYPDHMLDFRTKTQDGKDAGAHHMVGILTHAWYLMTKGGTHRKSQISVSDGLDWAQSEKHWYGLITTTPITAKLDFRTLAEASLARARTEKISLFTKRQTVVSAVACAWAAVGVFDIEKKDAELFRQLGVTCARGGNKGGPCDVGLNNCQRHEDCVVAKNMATLACKDEWVSAYASGGGPYCCAYCEKRSPTACGTCQVLGLRGACGR